MRITLLGTGTPTVDIGRMGPATLITLDGEHLLFDAGRGVTIQLVKANVSLKSIGLIFITHHHMDHISDLGDLLLSIWKAGRNNEIQIIGPNGTSEIVSALLNRVFLRDIEYTLALESKLKNNIIDIRELIKLTDAQPGIIYQNNNFTIKAEFVEHGQQWLGFSQKSWPSFGYRIETDQKNIALSGDTIICDGLMKLAQNADVLIQCCYLAETESKTSLEFQTISNHIITDSAPIGKFATRANVKILILTHFRKKSQKLMKLLERDIRKHFFGQLHLGFDLQILNLE